jgi:hypothetical protein
MPESHDGVLRAAARKDGPASLRRLNDDYMKQNENQDDKQDGADAAASVVAEAGAQAITAESKYENQNNQKDEHFFSVLRGFHSTELDAEFDDGAIMAVLAC